MGGLKRKTFKIIYHVEYLISMSSNMKMCSAWRTWKEGREGGGEGKKAKEERGRIRRE